MFKTTKQQMGFFFCLLIALSLWSSVLIFGNSSYADETTHGRQIGRFLKGQFDIMSDLTTIPGYHGAIALVAEMIPHPGRNVFRAISLGFSLISIFIFFLIAKKLGSKNPYTKTLQFVFLPITFFYFPLTYTDIFSLLLVLCAFYFAIQKRFSLATFFSFVSLLARQNNIIWVLFIWVYAYLAQNAFTFSREKILAHLKSTFGFPLIFGAFGLFVFLNNGVSIGDRQQQQVGFHLGNIYFFLAVAGVLFLPTLFSSLKNLRRAQMKNFLLFGVGIGFLVALSFVFFPPELHMYNLKLKFLRNIALHFAYGKYFWAYGLAIFLGWLAIFQMKFESKALLLFPFTFIYLVPSQLIEQRYYIIPLVFLLLFRKELGSKIENVLIIWFAAFSCALIYMLLKFETFF